MISRCARWLALCQSVLLVAACSFVTPETGFRDEAVPLGATSRFDALAFSGEWLLVASFDAREMAPLVVTPAAEVAHLRITSNEVPEVAGLYREGVPGELIPVSGEGDTLVVMWVDESFQSAAIGTSSGSFGAVLNRAPEIPSDRARAARDVFAFYGWDVSRLKRTIQ